MHKKSIQKCALCGFTRDIKLYTITVYYKSSLRGLWLDISNKKEDDMKKGISRAISLIMATALAVTALTGCGSGGGGVAPPKIQRRPRKIRIRLM